MVRGTRRMGGFSMVRVRGEYMHVRMHVHHFGTLSLSNTATGFFLHGKAIDCFLCCLQYVSGIRAVRLVGRKHAVVTEPYFTKTRGSFFPSTTTKTKSQVILILPPFSSQDMRATPPKKRVLRSKYENHENQYENCRVADYEASTIP